MDGRGCGKEGAKEKSGFSGQAEKAVIVGASFCILGN